MSEVTAAGGGAVVVRWRHDAGDRQAADILTLQWINIASPTNSQLERNIGGLMTYNVTITCLAVLSTVVYQCRLWV